MENNENSQKIGWIGTGIMGNPMCRHLIEAGHTVFIHNRTKTKALPLIKRGANWCDSPSEVAENSKIVFIIVNTPKEVEAVVCGQKGLIKTMKKNGIIVDMTTSNPLLASKLFRIAKKEKINFLDAPVTGGETGAKVGTLTFMVGGNIEIYNSILYLLKILGNRIYFMGDSGSGCKTKLCHQVLSGSIIFLAEASLLAKKMNLDYSRVLKVISSGFSGSKLIKDYGKKILEKDDTPGFSVKNFVKDIALIKVEAKRLNINLPAILMVENFLKDAMSKNWENKGIHTLYNLISS